MFLDQYFCKTDLRKYHLLEDKEYLLQFHYFSSESKLKCSGSIIQSNKLNSWNFFKQIFYGYWVNLQNRINQCGPSKCILNIGISNCIFDKIFYFVNFFVLAMN